MASLFNFNSNKTNAVNELLEAISKGVDLLGRENITKNLLDAWEKYAISTLELVDMAYNTDHAVDFLDANIQYSNLFGNHFGLDSSLGYPINCSPMTSCDMHTAFGEHLYNPVSEYKKTLQTILQRLIAVAKRLPKE